MTKILKTVEVKQLIRDKEILEADVENSDQDSDDS